jgi:hypothetical protein
MSNPSKSWTMTPQQFAGLEAEVNAAALGISISGNAGEATHDGATVGWTFNGETLVLTVEHALPFTAGMVVGKVAAAIDQGLKNLAAQS